MLKKALSLLMALVMIVGMMTTVFAETTGNAKIDSLVEKGIVLGDERGLRLEDKISRAEFTVLIVKMLDKLKEAEALKNVKSVFSDLPMDHWSNGFVNLSVQLQIIRGYEDGTFRGNNDVTYAEAIKMITAAVVGKELPQQEGQLWYIPYVLKATELKLLDDTKIPSYSDAAVREQVFLMIYNAMQVLDQNDVSVQDYVVMGVDNYRTNRIAKDEMGFRVLEAPNKGSFKVGDVITLKVPSSLNVIDSMGTVFQLSLKDSKVTEMKIHPNYAKVRGKVSFESNSILVDNRPYRMANPFLDITLNYEKISFEKAKKELASKVVFGVVSHAGGDVVSVQLFELQDISPVAQFDKSNMPKLFRDEDMTFSDVPSKGLFLIEDTKMSEIQASDLKLGDVVHAFGKEMGLVSRDQMLKVKSVTAGVDTSGFHLLVDGNKIPLSEVKGSRAVISIGGTTFRVISQDGRLDFDALKPGEITVATDLTGYAQYVGGEVSVRSGGALVRGVVSDSLLVYFKGEEVTVKESFDLEVVSASGSRLTFRDLFSGDLVWLEGDDASFKKVMLLRSAKDIDSAKRPTAIKNGWYDVDLKPSQGRFATLMTDKLWTIQPNTPIYNVETENGRVKKVTPMKIEDFAVKATQEKRLMTYVMSGKEWQMLSLPSFSGFQASDDVAALVLFYDFMAAEKTVSADYYLVSSEFVAGTDKSIYLLDRFGNIKNYRLAANYKGENASLGTVFYVQMNSKNEVVRLQRVIDSESPKFEIKKIEQDTNTVILTLADAKGSEKRYYLGKGHAVFHPPYKVGDFIRIYMNAKGDIEALDVIK